MSAYKDRVAETQRVKEWKRARVERGAGDVPMEPRSEEQVADRRANCDELTKMEKTNDNLKRKSGSVKLEKMVYVHLHVGHHDRQEQLCVLPRMESCDSKNGRDNH